MPKIKKAVIAAAGWSTRFLPAVKAYAKPLVPILGKPVIQYLVEELLACGVDQICIIHRHGEKTIRRYFTPDQELENYLQKTGKSDFIKDLKEIWQKAKVIKFLPQGRKLPYGNATPILAAKSFIGKDPFVYMYSDDMILENKKGNYLGDLISLFEKYQPAAVAGSQKVSLSQINRLSSVKYAKDKKYPFRIEKVVEKPEPKNAFSNVALIGRFVISSKIFSVLQRQKIDRGELWLTNAINTLAQEGIVLSKPITQGEWMTTGDPLNWLKANIKFGLKDKKIGKGLKEFLGK